MNELSLFSGAGGGLLASRLLGWRTVCAVEFDRHRRDCVIARQNEGVLEPFPIWDDITTFDGLAWRGRVDVVSGGFPCQAYSTAARGRNVADDLWPEMRRVVAEVTPRYVFAENVSRRAIDAAADDLEQMGYQTKCIALSAADVGGDHIRPRYWLRAHADDQGELRLGVDAEVASRMERYRATGNGQIPIVAAAAWRLLSS
jgi:DNA (cytosine-5)-methyltransferase 1